MIEEENDDDEIRDEASDVEYEEYGDDEYEEIDSSEVESVVAGLRVLMDATTSETIRSYLSDTIADIEYLAEEAGMYDDGDESAEAA